MTTSPCETRAASPSGWAARKARTCDCWMVFNLATVATVLLGVLVLYLALLVLMVWSRPA